MPAPRDEIYKFCTTRLPAPPAKANDTKDFHHWGQVGFDNLAKDYGQGSGTTCGFLPHYLLWRFGCTDTTLVNRSEPQEGFRYRIGENLSIFQPQWKTRPRPSWVAIESREKPPAGSLSGEVLMDKARGPQPGDFIIIRGENWKDKTTGERTLDSAHIMVFLKQVGRTANSVDWLVAQSGMSTSAANGTLMQAASQSILTGTLKNGGVKEAGREVFGPQLVFYANIHGEEWNFPRRVIGYTNLDALTWAPSAAAGFHRLVFDDWMRAADNQAGHVNKWLGWYTMENAGGFIMMNQSYVLLHRGHEAYRFDRPFSTGMYNMVERGLWTLQGDTVALTWADSRTTMSWRMQAIFYPKVETIGTPLNGSSGKLTRIAAVPGGKLPDWIPANWDLG